jgi:Mor family transcriptional regulator
MQKSVKALADVIGLGEAIEVCRRWGGRSAYIPTTVRHGDPLALALGLDTARLLVKAFGGQQLQLPGERNTLLDMRNAAIVADAEAGMSHQDIALRYGLSRQGVGHILAKMRAQAPQAPQALAAIGAEARP